MKWVAVADLQYKNGKSTILGSTYYPTCWWPDGFLKYSFLQQGIARILRTCHSKRYRISEWNMQESLCLTAVAGICAPCRIRQHKWLWIDIYCHLLYYSFSETMWKHQVSGMFTCQQILGQRRPQRSRSRCHWRVIQFDRWGGQIIGLNFMASNHSNQPKRTYRWRFSRSLAKWPNASA